MKLLMESKKYGRKDDGEEGETAPAKDPVAEIAAPDDTAEVLQEGSPPGSPMPSEGPAGEDETGQGFDYSASMSTSRFNVQVRIGPNGETILDEESLYVDRNDETENLNYTHIEESDNTKFVNSATYGKKFRGSRWGAEETELFFDVSHVRVLENNAHHLDRHFPSLARIMNSYHTSCLVVIEKLARISSKPKTSEIRTGSITL